MITTLSYEGTKKSLHTFYDNKTQALNSLAFILNLPKVPVEEGIYTEADLATDKFEEYAYTACGYCLEEIKDNIKVQDGKSFIMESDSLTELNNEDVELLYKYVMMAKEKAAKSKPANSTASEPISVSTLPLEVEGTAPVVDLEPIIDESQIPAAEFREVTPASEQVVNQTTPISKEAKSKKKDLKPSQAVTHPITTPRRPANDLTFMEDVTPKNVGMVTPEVPPTIVQVQAPEVIDINVIPQTTPAPNRINPVATPMNVAPENDVDGNQFILELYPFLNELTAKISSGNQFLTNYTIVNGIVRAKVSSVDNPTIVIDKLSITMDLSGNIVTNGAKWWPGIVKHLGVSPVDFKPAYKYDLEAISKYLAGEKIPESYQLYNTKTATLNRTVELKSLFCIPDIDYDTIKEVMQVIAKTITSEAISKKIKAECPNARFVVTQFADKDSFTLSTVNGLYEHIGGKVLKNEENFAIDFAKNSVPEWTKLTK